jgi:hypothetical protein
MLACELDTAATPGSGWSQDCLRTIRRDHCVAGARAQIRRCYPLLHSFHLLPVGLDDMHAVLAEIRDVEQRVVDCARYNLMRVRVKARGNGYAECRFERYERRVGTEGVERDDRRAVLRSVSGLRATRKMHTYVSADQTPVNEGAVRGLSSA